MLNSCQLLKDYSYFVQKVGDYACDMERQNAIMKAMDECIQADIFREMLEDVSGGTFVYEFWELDEAKLISMYPSREKNKDTYPA